MSGKCGTNDDNVPWAYEERRLHGSQSKADDYDPSVVLDLTGESGDEAPDDNTHTDIKSRATDRAEEEVRRELQADVEDVKNRQGRGVLGGVKTEVSLKTVAAGVWDGIPINLEEQSALLQAVGSRKD